MTVGHAMSLTGEWAVNKMKCVNLLQERAGPGVGGTVQATLHSSRVLSRNRHERQRPPTSQRNALTYLLISPFTCARHCLYFLSIYVSRVDVSISLCYLRHCQCH